MDQPRAERVVPVQLPIGYSGKAYFGWGADWNGAAYDYVRVQSSFDYLYEGDFKRGFC